MFHLRFRFLMVTRMIAGLQRVDWTGWCRLSLSVFCHTTSTMAFTSGWKSWVVKVVSRIFCCCPPAGHLSPWPTPLLPLTPTGGCRDKEFRCDNGHCVTAGPLGVTCDGVNDCGDGSDELHCGELTHLSHPWVVYCGGSMICFQSAVCCKFKSNC